MKTVTYVFLPNYGVGNWDPSLDKMVPRCSGLKVSKKLKLNHKASVFPPTSYLGAPKVQPAVESLSQKRIKLLMFQIFCQNRWRLLLSLFFFAKLCSEKLGPPIFWHDDSTEVQWPRGPKKSKMRKPSVFPATQCIGALKMPPEVESLSQKYKLFTFQIFC